MHNLNTNICVNGCEIQISGVAINSSQVEPGFAFVCIVGAVADGHKFALDAQMRGASVIVAQYEVDGVTVPQLIVEDTHKAAAEIACQFYQHPSKKMQVVGITGTNGKTTTSNIVAHVVQSSGKKVAVIGTTGIFINGKIAQPDKFKFDGRTTPDSISVQKLFYKLHQCGVQVVIMEVSSHALDQFRVWGTNYDVVAFSNLSQDHLDYHHTMQNYFEAKALLFTDNYRAKRVVCIDDEWGIQLAQRTEQLETKSNTPAQDKMMTCGLNPKAEINPKKLKVDFPLVGKFNTQNMLIAASICMQLNINSNQIIKALQTTPQVDGRMQVVNKSGDTQNAKVVVDYAHTPDALENAAKTLKEICTGNLVVLFGCGGDRDSAKRPIMGQIACKNADRVVVTTDNPRTEDPNTIINDIVAGLDDYSNYEVVVDRAQAISHAITTSTHNDIVLLAGKGHEDYQEINQNKIHFDDREQALLALYGE